ncbi:uncharacterized mitochondrial protein AtMg00810-like [Lycium ferocissimum]|uniref:uncharacterized mitochondrial protein AtMg00810-like n=1 Tax=Lycium ferocissimum TaxID=112874 RepID=UPI002814C18F|nr:uncharacterized mitochondrial protein AtMg00810-like [Lycium ferocissimum]
MYFLGIEFSGSEKDIHMCQRKYALELVSGLGLSGAKTAFTPLDFNHKLTSVEYDEAAKKTEDCKDPLLENRGSYQRIMGRYLYLTMTRPDLAFMVQVLSQYMHAPKQSHTDAALRVERYIKGSSGLGLFMPVGGKLSLTAFCDSDWVSCAETRKSVTGYLVKLDNALISWK